MEFEAKELRIFAYDYFNNNELIDATYKYIDDSINTVYFRDTGEFIVIDEDDYEQYVNKSEFVYIKYKDQNGNEATQMGKMKPRPHRIENIKVLVREDGHSKELKFDSEPIDLIYDRPTGIVTIKCKDGSIIYMNLSNFIIISYEEVCDDYRTYTGINGNQQTYFKPNVMMICFKGQGTVALYDATLKTNNISRILENNVTNSLNGFEVYYLNGGTGSFKYLLKEKIKTFFENEFIDYLGYMMKESEFKAILESKLSILDNVTDRYDIPKCISIDHPIYFNRSIVI